jgi:hypothetical protein
MRELIRSSDSNSLQVMARLQKAQKVLKQSKAKDYYKVRLCLDLSDR